MDFPAPGFVFGVRGQQGCGSRDNLEKEIHADRENGAIEERGACGFDRVADLREVIVPARGAGDGAYAERGEPPKIIGGGGGRGEFDGRGGAGESPAGKRCTVGAGESGNHMEAVLRSELLDETTHFAVADNDEWKAHAGGAPVVRSWRTMRA